MAPTALPHLHYLHTQRHADARRVTGNFAEDCTGHRRARRREGAILPGKGLGVWGAKMTPREASQF